MSEGNTVNTDKAKADTINTEKNSVDAAGVAASNMNKKALFEQLSGIEAIDKFIASEFAPTCVLTEQENEIWLHLLVLLSFMQRHGHSCVSLSDVAGQVLFGEDASESDNESGSNREHTSQSSDADQANGPKKGYAFDELTPLIGVVKKALSDERIGQLFVYNNGMFYSRRYYEFEREIALGVVARTAFTPLSEEAYSKVKALWPAMFSKAPSSEASQEYNQKPDQKLSQELQLSSEQDWQQIAVAKSIVQKFSVINGGPGTGKTYTVLRLLLALQACDDNINIVLAAPTGKAQQRMTESISDSIAGLRGKIDDDVLDRVPTQAVTIHRLLGLREHTVSTKYNRQNQLSLDVLIVDEASMVDLALMTRIIRALPEHARLYFIGDAEQLPAVELGNVLEQLVETNDELVNLDDKMLGAVPTALRQHIATLCPHLPLLPVDEDAKTWVHTLRAPQRFKGQVAAVATAIQKGDPQSALSALNKAANTAKNAELMVDSTVFQDGVHLWPEDRVSEKTLRKLAIQCFMPIFDATNAHDALRRLNKVRWLTPVRKGNMGVERLNAIVFDAIKHKITRREGNFYQGQPIMIVKNNHPQRLSNGEVGIIWPDSNGKLLAWFEAENDELRHISLSRVPQFETVYAMTIHKSQGSEFSHVVLLLPKPETEKAAGLFHRGLVYTGLTRAKKGCLIIANSPTFSDMVARVDRRYSGLANAIRDAAVDET
jgi:exodeoxyribonuclease V alpha subunit